MKIVFLFSWKYSLKSRLGQYHLLVSMIPFTAPIFSNGEIGLNFAHTQKMMSSLYHVSRPTVNFGKFSLWISSSVVAVVVVDSVIIVRIFSHLPSSHTYLRSASDAPCVAASTQHVYTHTNVLASDVLHRCVGNGAELWTLENKRRLTNSDLCRYCVCQVPERKSEKQMYFDRVYLGRWTGGIGYSSTHSTHSQYIPYFPVLCVCVSPLVVQQSLHARRSSVHR